MPRQNADKDYYAILGVEADATEETIRRTYRRLALATHPDRNAGDPRAAERFREISEAYAVLIDPARRQSYDHARRAGEAGGFGGNREDLFRDLFNDPRASAVFEELARELSRMGMRVDRQDFQRTLFGGRVVVTGGVVVITPLSLLRLGWAAARGLRAAARAREPHTALPPPPGLLGRAVSGARRLLGLPAAGEGPDVSFPLRLTAAEADRGGSKRVTLRRSDGEDEVLVTIPAGIRPGTRLRLRGKGRLVAGGDRGDAYLVVEVTGER